MTILSHLLFQVFIVIGLAVGGFLIFQNTGLVTLKIGHLVFNDTPLWLIFFSSFFIGLLVGLGLHFNKLLNRSKR